MKGHSLFIELRPEFRDKPCIINGVRYVRCRECAELKTEKEMVVYGGRGTINIGLCRSCSGNKK